MLLEILPIAHCTHIYYTCAEIKVIYSGMACMCFKQNSMESCIDHRVDIETNMGTPCIVYLPACTIL